MTSGQRIGPPDARRRGYSFSLTAKRKILGAAAAPDPMSPGTIREQAEAGFTGNPGRYSPVMALGIDAYGSAGPFVVSMYFTKSRNAMTVQFRCLR